jgi:hypothetical protein
LADPIPVAKFAARGKATRGRRKCKAQAIILATRIFGKKQETGIVLLWVDEYRTGSALSYIE